MMKQLTKPFILFTVLITLLMLASCSEDYGPELEKEEVVEQSKEEPKEGPKEEPKEEEPSPEESNKIADNVIIKGGTKVEGEPPAPNGAITLVDLTGTVMKGYLNEGFNIPLNSNVEIAGAYIQFKANDAAIAESYYDVDITKNSAFGKSVEEQAPKEAISRSIGSLASKRNFAFLDVDLGPEFSPGEFCYLICVYDAAGNISEPQEVCVKINAWGGNDDIIGEWHFIKSETYSMIAETVISPVNIETCRSRVYTCSNEKTLQYTSCTTKQYETFNFNADGTYTHTYGHVRNEIDPDASDVNCELLYRDTSLSFVINGNWSYESDTQKIIIIEYETNYDGTSGPFMETYEPGNAYVFDLSNVTVENGLFSWGYPLGTDLNADGEVNADDGGWINFYQKQ